MACSLGRVVLVLALVTVTGCTATASRAPARGSSSTSTPVAAVESTAGDEWQPLPASPLGPRFGHSAVWTGTEMVVWGGWTGEAPARDGAGYRPDTRSWRSIATPGIPARHGHVALWSGREMLVLGGFGGVSGRDALGDGAAYDPASDTWRRIADPPLPSGRYRATWTGTTVTAVSRGRVAEYDPSEDRWRELPAPALVEMDDPQRGPAYDVHWTGREVVVWGATELPGDYSASHGRVFDTVAREWRDMAAAPVSAGNYATAWLDDEFLVVSGHGAWSYSPSSDLWAAEPSPSSVVDTKVASDGRLAYFVARFGGTTLRYDAAASEWRRLPDHPLSERYAFGFVAAGRTLLIWGGGGKTNSPAGDGAEYADLG